MSDTPRTEAEVKFGLSDPLAGVVTVCADFACRLERELNAAQATIRQQQLLDEEIMRLRERVKRLEEAGNHMLEALYTPEPPRCMCYRSYPCDDCVNYSSARDAKQKWKQAKEAKP